MGIGKGGNRESLIEEVCNVFLIGESLLEIIATHLPLIIYFTPCRFPYSMLITLSSLYGIVLLLRSSVSISFTEGVLATQ